MSWLTSTVSANPKLRNGMLRNFAMSLSAMACWCGFAAAQGGTLHVPASVTAGTGVEITTTGSGKATFYLIGPSSASKHPVNLGEAIQVQPDDVQTAGRYTATVCSESCQSGSFYVIAAQVASMSFLVHPSRVPVAQNDAVSGVVFPFDRFRNLLADSLTINFQLSAGNASLMTRAIPTHNGVAWFRTSSGKSAGTMQVAASIHDLTATRVVRQVASEPCNLRIKGQRTAKAIAVETETVRDCGGNTVPDGTIVTFTAADADGKSTVDAPVKQGVARAQLATSKTAVISVASGVVMGNELRVGAQP